MAAGSTALLARAWFGEPEVFAASNVAALVQRSAIEASRQRLTPAFARAGYCGRRDGPCAHVLDDVGVGQRTSQFSGKSEANYGQIFVETLQNAGDDGGRLLVQPAGARRRRSQWHRRSLPGVLVAAPSMPTAASRLQALGQCGGGFAALPARARQERAGARRGSCITFAFTGAGGIGSGWRFLGSAAMVAPSRASARSRSLPVPSSAFGAGSAMMMFPRLPACARFGGSVNPALCAGERPGSAMTVQGDEGR